MTSLSNANQLQSQPQFTASALLVSESENPNNPPEDVSFREGISTTKEPPKSKQVSKLENDGGSSSTERLKLLPYSIHETTELKVPNQSGLTSKAAGDDKPKPKIFQSESQQFAGTRFQNRDITTESMEKLQRDRSQDYTSGNMLRQIESTEQYSINDTSQQLPGSNYQSSKLLPKTKPKGPQLNLSQKRTFKKSAKNSKSGIAFHGKEPNSRNLQVADFQNKTPVAKQVFKVNPYPKVGRTTQVIGKVSPGQGSQRSFIIEDGAPSIYLQQSKKPLPVSHLDSMSQIGQSLKGIERKKKAGSRLSQSNKKFNKFKTHLTAQSMDFPQALFQIQNSTLNPNQFAHMMTAQQTMQNTEGKQKSSGERLTLYNSTDQKAKIYQGAMPVREKSNKYDVSSTIYTENASKTSLKGPTQKKQSRQLVSEIGFLPSIEQRIPSKDPSVAISKSRSSSGNLQHSVSSRKRKKLKPTPFQSKGTIASPSLESQAVKPSKKNKNIIKIEQQQPLKQDLDDSTRNHSHLAPFSPSHSPKMAREDTFQGPSGNAISHQDGSTSFPHQESQTKLMGPSESMKQIMNHSKQIEGSKSLRVLKEESPKDDQSKLPTPKSTVRLSASQKAKPNETTERSIKQVQPIDLELNSGANQLTDPDLEVNFDFMKSKIQSPNSNQFVTINQPNADLGSEHRTTQVYKSSDPIGFQEAKVVDVKPTKVVYKLNDPSEIGHHDDLVPKEQVSGEAGRSSQIETSVDFQPTTNKFSPHEVVQKNLEFQTMLEDPQQQPMLLQTSLANQQQQHFSPPKPQYGAMPHRELIEHKKLRERQVLQMQTRIQYLQGEEQKKVRKMQEMQRHTEMVMKLRFEAKNLHLKKKLLERASVIEKKSQVQQRRKEHAHTIARMSYDFASQRTLEASLTRKESKKLNRIKLSSSIHVINENIRHRDRIFSHEEGNASKRQNQQAKVQNLLQTMQEKTLKKKRDLNSLRQSDQEVRDLAKIEKQLLDKLHRTIQASTNLEEQMKVKMLKHEQILQQAEEDFNNPKPIIRRKFRKRRSPRHRSLQFKPGQLTQLVDSETPSEDEQEIDRTEIVVAENHMVETQISTQLKAEGDSSHALTQQGETNREGRLPDMAEKLDLHNFGLEV